jgi:uncharacterized protein
MSDSINVHEQSLRSLLRHLPASVQQRLDGWANSVSALGSVADKVQHTAPTYFNALNDTALAAMYHGDALSRKAVSKRVETAFSKGIRASVPDEAGGIEAATALQDSFDTLQVVQRFTEACTWEALFGGAVIWIGIDDGQRGMDSQARPVNVEQLQQVLWLKVIDRRHIRRSESQEHVDMNPSSPTYGEPTHYVIDHARSGLGALVHRSRLIVFPGLAVTPELRDARSGWGISTLDPIYETLQRHVTAWQAAGNAVANAQYVVMKLNGLAQMLGAAGGEELLRKRSRAMEIAKSSINAILIDKGDEYIRERADFGRMPEMLEAFMYDVAQAFDMPVTVVFGRSPAGMNATGESDMQLWHASVATWQAHVLRPRLEELTRLLMLSKKGPTKGRELSGWRIDFPPLGSITPTQDADRRAKQAQADAAYIEAGVLLPSEVALSRFRPEGYSVETTIDVGTRKAMQDAELAAVESAIAEPERLTTDAAPRGLFEDHRRADAWVDAHGHEHRRG